MINQLSLTQFRNIASLELTPSSGINFIVGENGSGKTSLLEAIYLLGMGRSFRSRTLKSLINADYDYAQVFARLDEQIPVGIRLDKQSVQIRLNKAPLKKLSELAAYLPLQLIPANCHQFFEHGPRFRRQLADWGVFHVEHGFLNQWQTYRKALQQRNYALRHQLPDADIQIWNRQLVQAGENITAARKNHLQSVLTRFQILFAELCPVFADADFSLRFAAGWPKETDFKTVLDTTLERDKALGYTRSGAHAADWTIRINGQNPAGLLSRGQQKLFFLAFSLSQLQLLVDRQSNQKSILLIDDLTSELDIQHQQLVLDKLNGLQLQTFVTSTETALPGRLQQPQNIAVFHVEHGRILTD